MDKDQIEQRWDGTMGQTAISCTDRKLPGSLPELRLTEAPGAELWKLLPVLLKRAQLLAIPSSRLAADSVGFSLDASLSHHHHDHEHGPSQPGARATSA
jgi:hypothetical protein